MTWRSGDETGLLQFKGEDSEVIEGTSEDKPRRGAGLSVDHGTLWRQEGLCEGARRAQDRPRCFAGSAGSPKSRGVY